MGKVSTEDRARALAPLQRPAATPQPTAPSRKAMIVYAREDLAAAASLAESLLAKAGPEAIWWEQNEILPGDDWDEALTHAFDEADALLACFGPAWVTRNSAGLFEHHLAHALERKKRVIPVLVGGLSVGAWSRVLERSFDARLSALSRVQAVTIVDDGDVARLVEALARLRARGTPSVAAVSPVDPDDPQRGQWGGKSQDRDRVLSATVREVSRDWFEIELSVASTTRAPLTSPVTFHLHPTFPQQVRTVDPVNGRATLKLGAWGAFTVGAETDNGQTRLELNLATAPGDFPQAFRDR